MKRDWSPQARAAATARMKALHADPEFRARHAAAMKALHADPEFRARHAARMKARNADPEFRARNVAARRGFAVPADKEADYRRIIRKGFSAAEAARMLGIRP